MDLLKSLWRGNVSLAKTFWLFGFCVNLLFVVGIYLYTTIFEQTLSTPAGQMSFWVLIIFSLIYFPFIYICIWRSANKYQGLQRCAIAAKIMVLMGWGQYIKNVAAIFGSGTP